MEVGIEQNAHYAMNMSLYVDYWKDIFLHLSKPLLVHRSLLGSLGEFPSIFGYLIEDQYRLEHFKFASV